MQWKQNTNLSVLSGRITAWWECVRKIWRSCLRLQDGARVGGWVVEGGGGGQDDKEGDKNERKSTESFTAWPLALCTWQGSAISTISTRPVNIPLFALLHLHSLHLSPSHTNHPSILASSHCRQTSVSAAVGADLFTLLSHRYTFTIEMVLFCIENGAWNDTTAHIIQSRSILRFIALIYDITMIFCVTNVCRHFRENSN